MTSFGMKYCHKNEDGWPSLENKTQSKTGLYLFLFFSLTQGFNFKY